MSVFTFLNIHRAVNEDQDNGLDTVFYPVTDKEIASLEVEIQSNRTRRFLFSGRLWFYQKKIGKYKPIYGYVFIARY